MVHGAEQFLCPRLIRPNKKISRLRVKGMESLGRIGTHFFK